MSESVPTPGLPPWVVLHVPHDAKDIPADVRSQFCVGDEELEAELLRMTDHLTHRLYADGLAGATVVRAPVSRLVVDAERFASDADEPMAARGMGVVYTATSDGKPLRRPIRADERQALLDRHYHPHHARLEAAVAAALDGHGRCLILDCHSFPNKALPYERADPAAIRPEICIGTDDFHTDAALAHAFRRAFEARGWTVATNTPFGGAIVPTAFYRKDQRVSSIMLEVNRRLYLDESDASPLPGFAWFAEQLRTACRAAIASWRIARDEGH